MLKNLEGIPSTCPTVIQPRVKSEVDKIANQVKTFTQAVDAFDDIVQPLPNKVKTVKDKAFDMGQLTAAGLLIPLTLVLVSCLTVILAVCCSCTGRCTGCCLRSLGPLLMAPTVLVIALVAAVQLELGIVTSSFCEDVDVNSLAFIGKLTGYDSKEYQLGKYYITGEGSNPLLIDLQNASQQLTAANKSITSYGQQAGLNSQSSQIVSVCLGFGALSAKVQALCSWRGLNELEKGTAAAQAALDYGDLAQR
eukprot:Skav204761  [mRNA]  locus=scaffold1013:291684:294645:+ [translate_table: standard]